MVRREEIRHEYWCFVVVVFFFGGGVSPAGKRLCRIIHVIHTHLNLEDEDVGGWGLIVVNVCVCFCYYAQQLASLNI